jgi:metalloendopeptidase OMA1, mitochondrial
LLGICHRLRDGALHGAARWRTRCCKFTVSARRVGVALPFSRSQETEVDRIALILMAKAGYDPRTALEF